MTDIPIAVTGQELETGLFSMYSDGQPGIIIPASAQQNPELASHQAVTHMVRKLLPRVMKACLGRTVRYGETDPLEIEMERLVAGGWEYTGVGDLHYDVWDDSRTLPLGKDSRDREVRVHHTVLGSGAVFLANSGTMAADAFPGSSELAYKFQARQADKNFQNGLVNPAIVNPHIHRGHLQPNDTIIFPVMLPNATTHDKMGPIWHRFDTDGARRAAWAARLLPE